MSWVLAAREGAGRSALRDPVPAGRVAFVNGGGTGTNLWGFVRPADDGAELAAREFAATARASAAAAPADRHVAVIGDGLLAYLLRRLLPEAAAEASTEASVVIDTTGSSAIIGEAVATLPRLGHLILAAPPRDTGIHLATYRDVHVRALTITGIGWSPGSAACASEDDTAIGEALRLLVRVAPGHTMPDGGAWYAVPGRELA